MNRIGGNQGRIFLGILIIIIGLLFLLANLGKLDIGEIFSTYWPLILIFIGLWHLVAHDFRDTGFGIILIVIGAFFMLVNWNIFGGSVWHYFWPLLIIGAGFWIIFKRGFRHHEGEVPSVKAKDLDSFTIFSGMKRRFDAEEFRGGKATVLFGGIELDFSQAKLAEDKATIELTAVFGGIDIWVPNDWKVVVDSSSLFGGVEDKHRTVPSSEAKATLFVRATALFGGIEIK